MRLRTRIIIALVLLALVVSITMSLHHVSAPRIVGRSVAADGTEMCIVQECNWSLEPFTTSFVYRRPGSAWRRFYFDHEDIYWGSTRATIDTNRGVAVFYRGSLPAVTFAWADETYTLHRWNRVDTDPMQMPAGWSPQLSVYRR